MSEPIRVLFIDDEPKLRAAWERLLVSQPDMVCVGTLASADGAEQAAASMRADVVLMDLTMPGADPLETVAAMSAAGAASRVVVYSGHSDPKLIQQALDAGAWGFVDKLTSPRDILEKIRRVAAGEMIFPPGFTG